MLFKKYLGMLLVLCIVAFLFSSICCKKQSTSPDVGNMENPVIWMNLFNMSFAAYEAGPNPSNQILQIKNSGPSTLDYVLSADADWVTFSPEGGTSSGQINEHTISVNKNGLTARDDNYTATISITSSKAYNNPQALNVNLKLSKEPPPEIWVSTKELTFTGLEGGNDPTPQTLIIRNSGSSTLNYQIQDNANWLNVNPKNGSVETGEKAHTVSVDSGGLNEGTYYGTITIADPNAKNNPQQIEVTLKLRTKTSPPPPSTANRVGISISPSSGGTDTIVRVTVSIDGNTSAISTFGLKLNYNTSIFQYQGTSRGTLTGNWAFVDGSASAGVVTVGGLRGSASAIPIGSQGSIAVVRFRVLAGSSQITQITMNSLTDDLSGMVRSPSSVTFTRN